MIGDMFPDGHASGKRNQLNMVIGDHLLTNIARKSCHDRQHLRRQSGFVQHVCQCKCRQRRQFGRLTDHAVIGGNRGCHLVSDHIHRMIEWRNRRDCLQRVALGIYPSLFTVRRKIA